MPRCFWTSPRATARAPALSPIRRSDAHWQLNTELRARAVVYQYATSSIAHTCFAKFAIHQGRRSRVPIPRSVEAAIVEAQFRPICWLVRAPCQSGSHTNCRMIRRRRQECEFPPSSDRAEHDHPKLIDQPGYSESNAQSPTLQCQTNAGHEAPNNPRRRYLFDRY